MVYISYITYRIGIQNLKWKVCEMLYIPSRPLYSLVSKVGNTVGIYKNESDTFLYN